MRNRLRTPDLAYIISLIVFYRVLSKGYVEVGLPSLLLILAFSLKLFVVRTTTAPVLFRLCWSFQ